MIKKHYYLPIFTIQQLLTSSSFVLSGLVFSVFFISLIMVSLIGWGHDQRLLEESTYWLGDMGILIMGMLWGTEMLTRDFSERGLALFLSPLGLSPKHFWVWRFIGLAMFLMLVVLFFFGVRGLFLFMLTRASLDDVVQQIIWMSLYTTLHVLLAVLMSMMLSFFVSAPMAVILTLFLLWIGHSFHTFEGLWGLQNQSPALIPLLKFFQILGRVWNPSLLVLPAKHQQWLYPSLEKLLRILVWWGGMIVSVFLLGFAKLQQLGLRTPPPYEK